MKTPVVIIILASFLISSIIGPMPDLAQADEFHLPVPGVMVHLSPPLDPPILKGIKVYPDNPFRFDFILDKGDENTRHPERSEGSQQEQLKQESTKLIKYFLASLTIPEKDLWVNLSPYEKNRIIPQSFGLTEMGRDLLGEDYMLKQITASLIYPEDEIGKKFWKRIYEESTKRYGTTNIPVNTFNKVWIVPQKAVVYENAKTGTAYVVESKLKVMLEQDYLALSKNNSNHSLPLVGRVREGGDINALGSQIVREIVIPELTREVNEDKNFAKLRQVYNSLILATWYKKKIKDSILEQVYADKNKTVGVQYTTSVIPAKAGIHNKNDIEAIYQRYLQAFKKGVYNYIKEDIDPVTQETIPRKYFSGGMSLAMTSLGINPTLKITYEIPNKIDGSNAMIVEMITKAVNNNNLIDTLKAVKLKYALQRIIRKIPKNNKIYYSPFLKRDPFYSVLGYALSERNLDFINEFENSLNPQLEALKISRTSATPTLDEKLAYICMRQSKDYLAMVEALVALKRPLAALILFAANGPHTRREFVEQDMDDKDAQKILINGFISHLKALLDALDNLKRNGKEDANVLIEAQKYAGGLFNGLLMRTDLEFEDYVKGIAGAVEVKDKDGRVINLYEVIQRSAKLLPEGLPEFLGFVGGQFGTDEIREMEENNESKYQKITAQQVFLGVSKDANDAKYAEEYMRSKEESVRRSKNYEGVDREFSEKGYYYLRNIPDAFLAASPAIVIGARKESTEAVRTREILEEKFFPALIKQLEESFLSEEKTGFKPLAMSSKEIDQLAIPDHQLVSSLKGLYSNLRGYLALPFQPYYMLINKITFQLNGYLEPLGLHISFYRDQRTGILSTEYGPIIKVVKNDGVVAMHINIQSNHLLKNGPIREGYQGGSQVRIFQRTSSIDNLYKKIERLKRESPQHLTYDERFILMAYEGVQNKEDLSEMYYQGIEDHEVRHAFNNGKLLLDGWGDFHLSRSILNRYRNQFDRNGQMDEKKYGEAVLEEIMATLANLGLSPDALYHLGDCLEKTEVLLSPGSGIPGVHDVAKGQIIEFLFQYLSEVKGLSEFKTVLSNLRPEDFHNKAGKLAGLFGEHGEIKLTQNDLLDFSEFIVNTRFGLSLFRGTYEIKRKFTKVHVFKNFESINTYLVHYFDSYYGTHRFDVKDKPIAKFVIRLKSGNIIDMPYVFDERVKGLSVTIGPDTISDTMGSPVRWSDIDSVVIVDKALLAKSDAAMLNTVRAEDILRYNSLKNVGSKLFSISLDKAMTNNTGGIDLTPANMHLETQQSNGEIKFHLDPAMLKQLQNAPGFIPVIINIQPMTDLRKFLGLADPSPSPNT